MFKRFLNILIFTLVSVYSWGQTPATTVKIGPEKTTIDQGITIEIIVYGKEYNVDGFPEIKGFVKENTTTSHGEIKLENEKLETHKISKVYRPETVGEIVIPDLEIVVNDEVIEVPSKTIIVEGDEFTEIDFDVQDADFVVEVSKKVVYVGEGLKIRMSFYISEKNTQNWQFVSDKDLSSQIEKLSAQIKPENSLESRRIINKIEQRIKTVRGVRYLVYDIFEAVYYPLNNDQIRIPALKLKMKIGEDKEAYLTSKNQNITVKELPEHPLKDKVPVGLLSLGEKKDRGDKKQTGESFNYSLIIRGQANLSGVNFERVGRNKNMDFFDTDVQLRQDAGNLNGEKEFNYKVLPKIAGNYNLGDYFNLIYFNIKKQNYDTLRAETNIEIFGDSVITQDVVSLDIYNNLENLSTSQKDFNYRSFLKIIANIIWVSMIIIFIYILRKK